MTGVQYAWLVRPTTRYTKDHVDAHIAHEIVVLRLPTTSRLAVHSVIERRA